MKLVLFIDPIVRKNGLMAEKRTGETIRTEIALPCALYWLHEGVYHDIKVIGGVSRASFYVYSH